MKFIVIKPVSIDISKIIIDIPMRYDDEDVPYDFPLRKDDQWRATVDLETGIIAEWPRGKSGRMQTKVCDEGIYTLLDYQGNVVAEHRGYVPHGVVPGEYGDYVDLQIDETGKITNWPKRLSVDDFFGVNE